MQKSIVKKFGIASLSALLLAQVAAPTIKVAAQEENEDGILSFEKVLVNEGEPIEGGELRVALVSDTPFSGILNGMYATIDVDMGLIDYFNDSLYGFDENFRIDNSGFADVEFIQEDKTIRITIPEGVTWHDGEEITIDDVIYPYYVVGHPDYTGIRYGRDFQNVVGMEEYHNGEAEEISGLTRVDDYTLEIEYKVFTNSLLQSGGGLSYYVVPEHLFSEYEIADLEDSDVVRSNLIGFGAWKVDAITPGEAITFVRNEDYYRGAPAIETLTVEVVSPATIVEEMKAGRYDVSSLPADQYDTFKDAENFTVLGQLTNTYNYTGFRMGFRNDDGTNTVDESLVTTNKALRQAMGYAIDNDAIGEKFYFGLRERANSHIPPIFEDIYNAEQEGYPYDPEKAKQLLDEAGFKDTDGDGYVEDPEGNAFTLGLAAMSGGDVAEPVAQYYIQSWAEIGVNVELVDGRLMDVNTFYDRLDADDPAIDIFNGAWVTGGDPNPAGFYRGDAGFNYARYYDEKTEELLDAIVSPEAFDPEVRKQAFKDWQEYYIEQAVYIPTLFRQGLSAVNNRVSNWDITTGTELEWSEIKLLSEDPAVNQLISFI